MKKIEKLPTAKRLTNGITYNILSLDEIQDKINEIIEVINNENSNN